MIQIYYSGNRYLTMEEMKVNANYIFKYLTTRGWSKNAIAGLLGNLQTESTINPGIWEGLIPNRDDRGYGLVQWTPSTKYLYWANDNNLVSDKMDSNLKRIEYEVINQIQWGNDSKGNRAPLTFKEFTESTLSPYELGMMFLHHYERPLVYDQPIRGTQAEFWYSFIGQDRPVWPTTEGLRISSPFGWRIHPEYGDLRFHGGIDIGGAGVNHPIYATQSGVIINSLFSETGGYMMNIQHTGDDYYSQYMHLKELSPLPVGSSVTKGQHIATMGTTGISTGIHLHFAICKTATGWHNEDLLIDPEIYLEMGFDPGPDPEPIAKKKSRYKPWLYQQQRRIIIT